MEPKNKGNLIKSKWYIYKKCKVQEYTSPCNLSIKFFNNYKPQSAESPCTTQPTVKRGTSQIVRAEIHPEQDYSSHRVTQSSILQETQGDGSLLCANFQILTLTQAVYLFSVDLSSYITITLELQMNL